MWNQNQSGNGNTVTCTDGYSCLDWSHRAVYFKLVTWEAREFYLSKAVQIMNMSLGRERVELRAGTWAQSLGLCLGSISENFIASPGLCFCCCEVRDGGEGAVPSMWEHVTCLMTAVHDDVCSRVKSERFSGALVNT